MSDMALKLSTPKGRTRWRGNLKGLSHERGWIKPAENLLAPPFKRDPFIDIIFSQVNSMDGTFNYIRHRSLGWIYFFLYAVQKIDTY
jgi:hypothetical protein